MCQDSVRECFTAFSTLAKEPTRAVRLSIVRAMCEELLRCDPSL